MWKKFENQDLVAHKRLRAVEMLLKIYQAKYAILKKVSTRINKSLWDRADLAARTDIHLNECDQVVLQNGAQAEAKPNQNNRFNLILLHIQATRLYV